MARDSLIYNAFSIYHESVKKTQSYSLYYNYIYLSTTNGASGLYSITNQGYALQDIFIVKVFRILNLVHN